jgi:hypothetical protein
MWDEGMAEVPVRIFQILGDERRRGAKAAARSLRRGK